MDVYVRGDFKFSWVLEKKCEVENNEVEAAQLSEGWFTKVLLLSWSLQSATKGFNKDPQRRIVRQLLQGRELVRNEKNLWYDEFKLICASG